MQSLSNLKRLYIKVTALLRRGWRYLRQLPLRLLRLFQHLFVGIRNVFSKSKSSTKAWWLEFGLLLSDVAAIPEALEASLDFLKWNTRPLSPLETRLVTSVFGNSLNIKDIVLDEKARIICKKRKIAYVSFCTVNSWGKLEPHILIHELVHVWQFQRMGSSYISKALFAQQSKEGYNYGGVAALKKAMETGKPLTAFNLEQQAEIVADYFAIREGLKPSWGDGNAWDLPIYQYFTQQLRG